MLATLKDAGVPVGDHEHQNFTQFKEYRKSSIESGAVDFIEAYDRELIPPNLARLGASICGLWPFPQLLHRNITLFSATFLGACSIPRIRVLGAPVAATARLVQEYAL
jgi:hypothetical protein